MGTISCYENLKLIDKNKDVFERKLQEKDKSVLFEGLEDILPEIYIDKIWKMIYERYQTYENL